MTFTDEIKTVVVQQQNTTIRTPDHQETNHKVLEELTAQGDPFYYVGQFNNHDHNELLELLKSNIPVIGIQEIYDNGTIKRGHSLPESITEQVTTIHHVV